ncbi:MAG: 2-phospho-L-lactate transferase [Candidatus Nanopelagicales bacterium]
MSTLPPDVTPHSLAPTDALKIVVPAGGIGGARFLRGLRHLVGNRAQITVIGNTGDDIWVHGLRVCPDLDTVMYTLGGGISEERGWGREDETFTVKDELATYGVEPTWFGLGDRDTATHLIRTQLLHAGYPLSAVTEALCDRWQPGVRLIPMSDERVETHVVVDDPELLPEPGQVPTRRAIHFQEWWIRYRARIPAHSFAYVGLADAKAAPGVLEAIDEADLVIIPPSNPVVSVGTIMQIPGVREAIVSTPAPVVGISPIIAGAPVRGMADACLRAIDVETNASAIARHYGPRTARIPAGASGGGILDAWLIDTADAASVPDIEALGIRSAAVPLLMNDTDSTAAIARAAMDLVGVNP